MTTAPTTPDPASGTAVPGDSYEFWLFDLDGTLVDVHTAYARSVMGRVGERLGVAVTDRQAETLWYGASDARARTLERLGLDPERFWRTFHDVEDPAARAESTYLYEDAAAIRHLDTPVGLVTHCQEYLTDPVLERHGIADWFDAVVCCTEETGWKPDPAPVETARASLAVEEGDRGVLVGNSPGDIGAAWNAGLDGVHVARPGPTGGDRCVLADYRIERLDGIGS